MWIPAQVLARRERSVVEEREGGGTSKVWFTETKMRRQLVEETTMQAAQEMKGN
jgi:hypothetical protein